LRAIFNKLNPQEGKEGLSDNRRRRKASPLTIEKTKFSFPISPSCEDNEHRKKKEGQSHQACGRTGGLCGENGEKKRKEQLIV